MRNGSQLTGPMVYTEGVYNGLGTVFIQCADTVGLQALQAPPRMQHPSLSFLASTAWEEPLSPSPRAPWLPPDCCSCCLLQLALQSHIYNRVPLLLTSLCRLPIATRPALISLSGAGSPCSVTQVVHCTGLGMILQWCSTQPTHLYPVVLSVT